MMYTTMAGIRVAISRGYTGPISHSQDPGSRGRRGIVGRMN